MHTRHSTGAGATGTGCCCCMGWSLPYGRGLPYVGRTCAGDTTPCSQITIASISRPTSSACVEVGRFCRVADLGQCPGEARGSLAAGVHTPSLWHSTPQSTSSVVLLWRPPRGWQPCTRRAHPSKRRLVLQQLQARRFRYWSLPVGMMVFPQAQRDDADHGGHQLQKRKACRSCDQLSLLHGVVAQHVGQSRGRTRVDQLSCSAVVVVVVV